MLSACVRQWRSREEQSSEESQPGTTDTEEFRFASAAELARPVERSSVLLRVLYVLGCLADTFSEKQFDFSTESLLELLDIANVSSPVLEVNGTLKKHAET